MTDSVYLIVSQHIALQLEQTEGLLNRYVKMLSTSEDFARLIFDEQWQGAEEVRMPLYDTISLLKPIQDEATLIRERQQSAQRARREAEEKALSVQRERERGEREERERAEREEQERTEQEKHAKTATRGGIRGVRGTRASMRGQRGGAVFASTSRGMYMEPVVVFGSKNFVAASTVGTVPPSTTATRGRPSVAAARASARGGLPRPSTISRT
jgi:hypothetical protein